LIIGAGAIGAYVGLSLEIAGFPTAYLARPASAAGLRNVGLQLRNPESLLEIQTPVVFDNLGDAIKDFVPDFIFIAVKSYHTALIASQLAVVPVALPPVVCLQNGVENEPLLAEQIGEAKIISASVTTAVSRPDQSYRFVVEKPRGIGVASRFPGDSEVLRLTAAMEKGGLGPRLYSNARGMKWSKLITNQIGNTVSALTGLNAGSIYSDPALFSIEQALLKETIQVIRAQRLDLVNLPGLPVRALAWALRLPAPAARRLLAKPIGAGRGDKMPSLYLDLESGRQENEVAYLHRPVILAGHDHGIPTPINAGLCQRLEAMFSGELSRTAYSGRPTDLGRELAEAV
jgi:2-dehydropantoate 2-reductase